MKKNENMSGNRLTDKDTYVIKEYNRTRLPVNRGKLCHAPFRNMYFGFGGVVTSCCFNRDHVLGHYPGMSVREIWDGRARKDLCRRIEKKDLTSGCHLCEDLLLKRNFEAVGARFYDMIHPPSKQPLVMEFELADNCNLACIMCSEKFSSTIRREKNLAEPVKEVYDEKFVQQLIPFLSGLRETKFYGGEPFLVPLYYEIWEQLIRRAPGCSILVQTNGTIMNEKVESLLYSGKFNIGVSIDSVRRETFEKIRVHADYEKVMRNIHSFAKYCKTSGRRLVISVCPMRENWEEIPEIIHFAQITGADIFFNTVWHPPELALWSWDAENLLTVVNSWSREIEKLPESMRTRQFLTFEALMRMVKTWYGEALKRDLNQQQTNRIHEKSTYELVEFNRYLKLFLEKIEEYAMGSKGSVDESFAYAASMKHRAQEVISGLPRNQVLLAILKDAVENYKIPEIFDNLKNKDLSLLTAELKELIQKSSAQ
jgi:sulfatase maturation enzyme AslB (radical SAM superfamily)